LFKIAAVSGIRKGCYQSEIQTQSRCTYLLVNGSIYIAICRVLNPYTCTGN
jgi:hypothetical protein